jgi:hypothetical protein
MTTASLQARCQEYLSSRSSDYEFRSIRFRAVAEELHKLGLKRRDAICDLGAGRQDFCKFMRDEYGWCGDYFPVDGSIDGTDLQFWDAPFRVPFYVCIEVLEHLHAPQILMNEMMKSCEKGAVATTPNPAVVDVMACDPTHVCEVPEELFNRLGWTTHTAELFKTGKMDSIVAVYRRKSEEITTQSLLASVPYWLRNGDVRVGQLNTGGR